MKKHSSYIGVILILLFGSYNSTAQIIDDVELSQDSILNDNTVYTAKKSDEKDGFLSMFEGNPGKAALYSAILPGAGQIFNKRWLKAPIVWGLEGTAIGFIVYFSQVHNLVDLKYKGMARGEITEWQGYTTAAALRTRRDNLKKVRDYSYVGLAVIHVLNIADAFVDRHLIEFDVNEDISLRLGPANHGIGITMSLH